MTPERLLLEPVVERLHLFFCVRWKQAIDRHVERRYEDGPGVRERIVAVLPVIVLNTRNSGFSTAWTQCTRRHSFCAGVVF